MTTKKVLDVSVEDLTNGGIEIHAVPGHTDGPRRGQSPAVAPEGFVTVAQYVRHLSEREGREVKVHEVSNLLPAVSRPTLPVHVVEGQPILLIVSEADVVWDSIMASRDASRMARLAAAQEAVRRLTR